MPNTSFLQKIHSWLANNTRTVVILLFLNGILLSVPSLFFPMLSEADAYARSLWALSLRNAHTVYPLEGGAWLPLYQTFLASSLFIYNNIFISPRVISLLLHAGSVPFLYLLSLELFRKKKSRFLIALLAASGYLFFPLRLFYATQTLSEPTFLFFLISSLYFFIKKQPQYGWGIVLLNIAHGIRYESWFLMPVFWILIWIDHKQHFFKKAVFSFCTIIFPLLWLTQNHFAEGQSLFFFTEKLSVAQAVPAREYGDFLAAFRVWGKNILELLSPFGLILWCIGFILSLKKLQKIPQILVTLLSPYLFLTLILQVYLGTMEWFPHRYLFILTALGLPFLAYGFAFLAKKIIRFPSVWQFACWGILAVLIAQSYTKTMTAVYNSQAIDLIGPANRITELSALLRFYKSTVKTSFYFGGYVHSSDQTLWLENDFVYFAKIDPDQEMNKSYEVSEFRKKFSRHPNLFLNQYIVFETPAYREVKEIFSENRAAVVLKNNSYTVIHVYAPIPENFL